MNALYGIAFLSILIYWTFVSIAYLKFFLLALVAFILLTQLGTVSEVNNSERKLSIAAYHGPNMPVIMSGFDVDVENAQTYINKCKEESGVPITMHHFVGFCCARALANQPDLNGSLRFGNFIPLNELRISLAEYIGKRQELNYVPIHNPEKKTLSQFAADAIEVEEKLIKKQEDDGLNRFFWKFVPTFLLEPALFLIGYLNQNFNIPLPLFGLEKNHWGNCIIYNMGEHNFDRTFLPLRPSLQSVSAVSFGKVLPRPIVVDDTLQIRNVIKVTLTLDHRCTDGARAVPIYKRFQGFLRDPKAFVEEDLRTNFISK